MLSAYVEDSDLAIVGLDDGGLLWYDLKSNRVLDKREHLHALGIDRLLVSGGYVLSASRDGVVMKSEIRRPSNNATLFDWQHCSWEQADFWGSKSRYSIYWLRNKHNRAIKGLRLCKGTHQVLLPGYSGTLFAVECDTGAIEVLCHIDKEKDMNGRAHYDTVFDADYDPGERRIYSCGGPGHSVVLVWDWNTYTCLGHLPWPKDYMGSMFGVRFTPASHSIVGVFEMGFVVAWDWPNIRKIHNPQIGRISALDASTDGTWFAVGSEDGTLATYQTSDLALISRMPLGTKSNPPLPIMRLSLSESEKQLVTDFGNGDMAVVPVTSVGVLSEPNEVTLHRISVSLSEGSQKQFGIKPFLND